MFTEIGRRSFICDTGSFNHEWTRMFAERRGQTTDDTDLKRARSLLARRHPRGFTFYLADPISSVQG